MGKIANRKEFTQRRRGLRKNQTDAERLLWSRLRSGRFFGLKFRRQYGLGPYILDFYCREERICIEIDGGQHATARSYDDARSKYLAQRRINIIRFWNNEIFKNLNGVMQSLCITIWGADAPEARPHPNPLPFSGEGE